jgi:hypothetical protein
MLKMQEMKNAYQLLLIIKIFVTQNAEFIKQLLKIHNNLVNHLKLYLHVDINLVKMIILLLKVVIVSKIVNGKTIQKKIAKW